MNETETQNTSDEATTEQTPTPTPKVPRKAGPLPVRLLFWNTFLLNPRPVPGGPALPAIADMAAPAAKSRAQEIGRRLFQRFDVMALAETFEKREQRLILDGWQGRPRVSSVAGPPRSVLGGPGGFSSSGLFTVINRLRVFRSARHKFATRGSYLHDADALANKGVVMVEVDADIGPGAGRIEIFSTHLCYGGGLLPGGGVDNPHRRHKIRMAQLDELVSFVQREHRPGNIIVLAGDFNVPAHDPDYPDGPTAQYDDMMARLAELGVRDLWVEHGDGDGPTCGDADDDFADQYDPATPDALITPEGEADRPAAKPNRQRIDYVFMEEPRADHQLTLDVISMTRYAFPRADDAPDRARLPRLSDHIALGVRFQPGRVD